MKKLLILFSLLFATQNVSADSNLTTAQLAGVQSAIISYLLSDSSDIDIVLDKETLGENFFNDTSLSLSRTMSCATCHNPEHAFIDNRDNGVAGATSLGDDNTSLGDRNTPQVGYASLIPTFNLATLVGGQFFDGRADDLIEQAKGPFLNSIEMQMPTEESVVERVLENDTYIASMKAIYGDTIFDDDNTAFDAIADAIAAFEETATFAPFDSAFDQGTMSAAAIRGEALFDAVRCTRCHDDRGASPLFSKFEYENLGVPTNTTVRNINAHADDQGLLEHPDVSDSDQEGKFKTPSLRNVAVTAPYMHNGVFQTLKAVVHFYNTRDVDGAINPETNVAWERAEIRRNMVRRDVGDLNLTDAEEDDIVEFLEALTDAQYENLIQ